MSIKIHALDRLAEIIACEVKELRGNICVGPGSRDHKQKFPHLSIIPQKFSFDPSQADETDYVRNEVRSFGPRTAVFEVGTWIGTIELRLGARTARQRYELEYKIEQVFLGNVDGTAPDARDIAGENWLRPGVILIDTPECDNARSAFELEDDTWENEKVFTSELYSLMNIQANIPALVRAKNIPDIDTLTLHLTQDLETVVATPAEVEAINKESVLVREDGSIVAPPEPMSASLAGVGALSAAVTRRLKASASFQATGQLSAAIVARKMLTASLEGAGAMTAAAKRVIYGSASVSGLGSLSATVIRRLYASASLAGVGSLTASIIPPITPLSLFDFSAPLTSWKDGFSGFTSPNSTDEWGLQETSGSYSNNVGSATLSDFSGYQGQTAVGLWDGSSYTSHKAWEGAGSGIYLQASDVSALETDTDSLAGRIVFRMLGAPSSFAELISKLLPGVGGWRLRFSSTTQVAFQIHDGTNYVDARFNGDISQFWDGSWHYISFYWDAPNSTLYLKSDVFSEQTGSSSTLTSGIATSKTLRVGETTGVKNIQVAYIGGAVGTTEAASHYSEDFWQHAGDPTGLLTTKARATAISVPVDSEHVAHFAPNTLAIGYNANFSDGSKRGLYCNTAIQNLQPYSEDLTGWINSNTTDAPSVGDALDGFRSAGSVTATANAGALYRNHPAVANTAYTFSVWIKRNGGSDVTGTLIERDIDAAINTTQAFTATDTWQRVSVTYTHGGTATLGGRSYITIDNSGESILVWGMQVEAGSYPTAYIRTSGAAATLSASSYIAASLSPLIAQGEVKTISVLARMPNVSGVVWNLQKSANINRKYLYYTTANNVGFQVFDGVAAFENTSVEPHGTPVQTEEVMRCVWDQSTAGDITGGKESVLVRNGSQIGAPQVSPWEGSTATGANADDLTLMSGCDGFLQRVELWDQLSEALP